MQTITTKNAPSAVGPYSQAMDTGTLVFCSGQLPLDPNTMTLIAGGITEQTQQVFDNITHVLAAAGLALSDVVKATVFMTDLQEFTTMNDLYAEQFGAHKPARSTIQVASLPRGARIEIEVIAMRKEPHSSPARDTL